MKKILFAIVVLILLLGVGSFVYYKEMLKPVSEDSKSIDVEITNKMAFSTLGDLLYEKKLIKSKLIYKIYVKFNNPTGLESGSYKLNQTMSLEQIIKILSNGTTSNDNTVILKFKEGLNIRKMATIIANSTDNSYDSVIDLAENTEYAKELIDKYWFLTDEILDKKIYYPLEGYLFPDTYEVYKNATVKDIFEKMLNQMNVKLTSYKEDIENSEYSVHELLSLASIVELESREKVDRYLVSGVFYNRLKINEPLGSDVTTYYAAKIDDPTKGLTSSQLNDCTNGYNTRGNCRTGLPVGPISNPSIIAFEAALNPKKSDYLFFVADCDGKIYYSKNSSEHNSIISKLTKEGNWCA